MFIQPSYAHYREQLFSRLAKHHEIHFVFERSSSVYPGNTAPGGISYSVLDHQFSNYPFGLLGCLINCRPSIVVSSVSHSFRSIVSFVYALLFRKRFVLWIEEWRKLPITSGLLKRVSRYFRNFVGAKIILHCHSLVASGSAARNYALFIGQNPGNIFMAVQSANDLRTQRNYKSLNSSPRTKECTFLYLGRMIRRKGIDVLLKAFSLLSKHRSHVKLLVVGDGPFRNYCQSLTNDLSLRGVTFIGPVIPHSVACLYQKADVFVLPAYYEPWGLVINEAMSTGLPVIATRTVGAVYDLLIDGYNGFVVKENDVLDLHRAMDNILRSDLSLMGRNSRLLFERQNNFDKMANSFSLAFEHARLKPGSS